MSFRRDEDQVDEIAEDPLADNVADAEEEEGGEDLFGENMARDYQERPELDQYDPTMLDDEGEAELTIADRRAADRAMDERDRAEERERRRRQPEASPNRFPLGFASPLPSDADASEFGGDSVPRKRRRTVLRDFDTPEEPAGEEMDNEEDVPETFYDLTHEKLGEGEIENASTRRFEGASGSFSSSSSRRARLIPSTQICSGRWPRRIRSTLISISTTFSSGAPLLPSGSPSTL